MDSSTKRVIVSLDNMTLEEAVKITELVKDDVAGVKVGYELLCEEGARNIMSALNPHRVKVFLDPKIHDIPETALQAAIKLTRLGAWIIDIHCSGGAEMMQRVREAVDRVYDIEKDHLSLQQRPLLIGVTILTSLDFAALAQIGLVSETERDQITNRLRTPGVNRTKSLSDLEETSKTESHLIREVTVRLARLAQVCGIDGVVCSAHEASYIRGNCGPRFQIITPGIRWKKVDTDDQARIATPAGAIEAGSDWLVIGRPVTRTSDPLERLRQINMQIYQALVARQSQT